MAEPTREDMLDAQVTVLANEIVIAADERDELQRALRAILTAYDALNAEPRIGDTAKRAAFVAAVDAARGCV